MVDHGAVIPLPAQHNLFCCLEVSESVNGEFEDSVIFFLRCLLLPLALSSLRISFALAFRTEDGSEDGIGVAARADET